MIRRLLCVLIWLVWGLPAMCSIVAAVLVIIFIAIIFWILGIEYDYECSIDDICDAMISDYIEFVMQFPQKVTKAKSTCDI